MNNITKEDKEIYNKVRKKRQKDTIRKLLIDFGDMPIFLIMLVSSIILSNVIAFYTYLPILRSDVSLCPDYGSYSKEIIYGGLTSLITIVILICILIVYDLGCKSYYERIKDKIE